MFFKKRLFVHNPGNMAADRLLFSPDSNGSCGDVPDGRQFDDEMLYRAVSITRASPLDLQVDPQGNNDDQSQEFISKLSSGASKSQTDFVFSISDLRFATCALRLFLLIRNQSNLWNCMVKFRDPGLKSANGSSNRTFPSEERRHPPG
jgi:hypothetical protein